MSGDTPVIAIDGPSASGKGTVASRVAQALGFHYLESGALYRLVALLSLRTGEMGETALAAAAERMAVAFANDKIVLENQDVTEKIRTEECTRRASEVAKLPSVRK